MYVWQGGPDAAIIESVMNPIANVPGLVGPLLATFFLRRFGSRMPLFALAALCQASAAAVFCRWASDRPARDIVTAQQQTCTVCAARYRSRAAPRAPPIACPEPAAHVHAVAPAESWQRPLRSDLILDAVKCPGYCQDKPATWAHD